MTGVSSFVLTAQFSFMFITHNPQICHDFIVTAWFSHFSRVAFKIDSNICSFRTRWLTSNTALRLQSVLNRLFFSVPWTLDLWFDLQRANSRPISPILLNQYMHWQTFGPDRVNATKHQLKHLPGVHLTIGLYMGCEAMLPAPGGDSLCFN